MQYTDRATAPLKFHKFLTWFALPLGTLVSLANALQYISVGYSPSIYFFLDMGYWTLSISISVLCVIGLWRYHHSGPLLLYARQILSICYQLIAILIFSSYGIPMSDFFSKLSATVTWLVIFVIYYQKRMPLFGGGKHYGRSQPDKTKVAANIPLSLRLKLWIVRLIAPNSLTARFMKNINQPGNEAMRDAFYQTHADAEKFKRPLVLTGNLIDDVRNVKERKDYYAKQVDTVKEMLDFGAIKEDEKPSFLRNLRNDLENLQEISLIWGAIMPLDGDVPDPYVLDPDELKQARNIQNQIHQKYVDFLACGDSISALGNVSDRDPNLRALRSREAHIKDDIEQLVEDLGAIYYP